ncbi:MAG: TIGR03915 family putative DNA repair protein [Clostridium sp.]|uniref:TIGR03915 family putative DNA repair protein n=1 Tax=Clostridium sp. TaxID=1506 RepID=UPI002FC92757
MVYTYDGSFDGFLTCVYESYYNKWPDNITCHEKYIVSFVDEEKYIEANKEKANKVKKSIKDKLSHTTYKIIYTVFLSSCDNKEKNLLNYIGLLFKYGNSINYHKQNPTIIYVDKIYARVKKEAHRFTGFVRFKDIQGVLYSKIEPDNNILELIASHFKDRFSNEKFIIHDAIRERAIIYDGSSLRISEDFNINVEIKIDDVYESLWRGYFKATNIKERENLKHQRGMMPKRYWSNLTEVEK